MVIIVIISPKIILGEQYVSWSIFDFIVIFMMIFYKKGKNL